MPSSGFQTCARSEEHTSELQSHDNLVCRLLLEKKTHTSATTPPSAAPPPCPPGPRPPGPTRPAGPRTVPRLVSPTASRAASQIGFFFFNNSAPPEISPLSLPHAFPI